MRRALFLENIAQAELTGCLGSSQESKTKLEYYWNVILKRPATKVSLLTRIREKEDCLGCSRPYDGHDCFDPRF